MSSSVPTFYTSPFMTRYASDEMSYIWSDHYKISTWRKLWCCLAQAQRDVGVDIPQKIIDGLVKNIDNIDQSAIAEHEKVTKHDVVANMFAFSDMVEGSKPYIHIGATSQFLVDNHEYCALRESMIRILGKTAKLISSIGSFASSWNNIPTVGMTHLQLAQPTTVGKRACMWAQDFVIAIEDMGHKTDNLKMRGIKGTTGTLYSFLELFDGDESKVSELEGIVCDRLECKRSNLITICGQTSPRILDASLISSLGLAASAAYKMCSDIRLLCSRGELVAPKGKNQIGSSAMPYKNNPIDAEKVCSLSRHIISLIEEPYHTAANQWLERSLDDSAGKRIYLPEVFLSLDEVLDTCTKIFHSLMPNLEVCHTNYTDSKPFFISEDLVLESVNKNGCDRDTAYTFISECYNMSMPNGVLDMELLKGLLSGNIDSIGNRDSVDRGKQIFKGIDLDEFYSDRMDKDYTGMAKKQTEEYIDGVISQIRDHYMIKGA